VLVLLAVASGCPATPDGHAGKSQTAGVGGTAGHERAESGGSAAPHEDAGPRVPEPIVETTPQPDAGQDAGRTDPEPPITEPVTEADYYMRNQRSAELVVVATAIVGDAGVELLEDTIPANSEVHIFHAWEGSGGHAMPSNFFGTFRVLVGDDVVYEGVRNDDWKGEAHGLVLTIEAEAPPGESVDFACEQATDCAIKNVGNCCGYYPRCVNADSPTPPVECEDGVGSVCGWPEISHCECVENTCRSMQGDAEI
jgi:hypothetical protein